MENTLSERLKKARLAASLTQKALADAIGVTQAAIQKIEAGRASQTTKLVDLARVLGVTPDWLSSGGGPMKVGDDLSSQCTTSKRDTYRVTVLDMSVSAGPGVINSEFVEIIHSVEYSSEEARQMFSGRKEDQIRIINVRGDSMSGTIEPGDLLFVDITVQHYDGDGIYAFLYDETAHVKRLQKMKDRLIVLSDNKTYPAWEPIERDEMNRVIILGKVIGSMPQTYRKHG